MNGVGQSPRDTKVEMDLSFHHRDRRLVYDVYGEGDDLLVYMHGLLLDSEMNRGIAQNLAGRGHRVVLLDLLGHGRSDKPRHASEYRMDTYAEDVLALLDELGAERAALGGLSLGANVSLFAATMRPERVRALVLEMPVMEWAIAPAALLFVIQLLLARYGRVPMGALARLLRSVPRTGWGPLNSILNAGSTEPDVTAAVLHGILVGPVVPTQEQRSHLAVPTLVLGHGNDLIHPFDDATNLAEQMPRATLLRAHSPLELRVRPHRLTEEIASFLSEVAPRRRPEARPRTLRPSA